MAPSQVKRIHGVDFSGATNAGKGTWIATGSPRTDGLVIEAVRPVSELPGSSANREPALAALVEYIRQSPGEAFGFDFPFGIPHSLMVDANWTDFVLNFGRDFDTPDAFRDWCRSRAEKKELKRLTDIEAKTPFASYNLRIYRQTFHGIRDVLAPLVREAAAAVAPMQTARERQAILMEVCPASVLKRMGLYSTYKGKGAEAREQRDRILATLQEDHGLHLADPVLRERVLEDNQGDAIDSLIAALATWRAVREPPQFEAEASEVYRAEGYVYC